MVNIFRSKPAYIIVLINVCILFGCVSNKPINQVPTNSSETAIKNVPTFSPSQIPTEDLSKFTATRITDAGDLRDFGWNYDGSIFFAQLQDLQYKLWIYLPESGIHEESISSPSFLTKHEIDKFTENGSYKIGGITASPSGNTIIFFRFIPENIGTPNPKWPTVDHRSEWMIYSRSTDEIQMINANEQTICSGDVGSIYSWSDDESLFLTDCEPVYGYYLTYLLIDTVNLKMINLEQFSTNHFNHDSEESYLIIAAALSHNGEKIAIFDDETKILAIAKTAEIQGTKAQTDLDTLATIDARGWDNIFWSFDDKGIIYQDFKTGNIDEFDIQSQTSHELLTTIDIANAIGVIDPFDENLPYFSWRISNNNQDFLLIYSGRSKSLEGLWLISEK